MQDIIRTKLEQKLSNEKADLNNYMLLANEAMDAGEMKIYGILKDIAYDEESHKRILEHLLGKEE